MSFNIKLYFDSLKLPHGEKKANIEKPDKWKGIFFNENARIVMHDQK